MRLSLVEDDAAQAELVSGWLEEAGHTVKVFPRGEPFLRALHQDTFDMAVLDWDLPDTTGIELLQSLRQICGWSMPVLFVTVRDREEDVVQALGAGADDYLSKPVSQAVLLARLAALGRRVSPPESPEVLEVAPFTLDSATNTVTRDGAPVELTEKEFQLASYLFRNPGRLLSRAHLLSEVWGVRSDLSTRTVDTHMSKLRRKLGLSAEMGWRLRAVYQHGYRLERLG